MQVSKYDNARHVNISGASAVVCLEQLRLAIFGKSLWMKGFSAFLGNLIERFIVDEEPGCVSLTPTMRAASTAHVLTLTLLLSRGFWLADYLSGCSHRIYEVCLPQCLNVMPTFASLATLIYREFSVPIIGLRTIEETAVLLPVSSKLSDAHFQSVFIIARSKEVALKIAKANASVLSRHADLLPKGADTGRTPGSSRAGYIISAMEGKFTFRGRGAGDDVKSARGSMSIHSINSIGRQVSLRSDNKITPLASEDDCGDCPMSMQESSSSGSPKSKYRVGGSVEREPGMSTTEDEEMTNEQHSPSVITLSPSEPRRRASSSYIPPPSVQLPGSSRSSTSATPRSPHGRELPVSPSEDLPSRSTCGLQVAIVPKRHSMPADASVPDGGPSANVILTHAGSYHTNTNGNGLPLNAAAASELQSVLLEHPPPKSVRTPKGDTENRSTLSDQHEPPSIRRRSVELGDLRVRRSSMLRSFRRTPPPANLEGHFVVCGTPSNYADFLANLSDLDEPVSPVVFVTPRDLREKDYDAYTVYDNLYFVRGSPVSMRVFHEARMPYARSILIMSYCASEHGLEVTESELEPVDENMADVDAITTHRFISNACQSTFQRSRSSIVPAASSPFVVIEMIKPSNCKFLVDRSGSLYDEKAIENEVRTRELLRDVKGIDDCLFSPLYASGRIYFPNLMDALLGSCSQHTLLIEMVTQLITSGNLSKQLPDHESRSAHRLSQVPAPSRFHFRPYSQMVEGMLKEEVRVLCAMNR